ncbi:hypothetical protein PV05_05685 [Exophiala xenobiotica]|uniref:Uncharacterized protein n=1 Tax=Exophiala xenobiotica TaxID=348802 RepID=A0A0D2FAN9_9EURO|nr:uncharacterized protein PV05_05685 [Exophiala xenobiotica]KIW57084.1 hypothetical protein PV05_05685 [Exophiala xenobiotica]
MPPNNLRYRIDRTWVERTNPYSLRRSDLLRRDHAAQSLPSGLPAGLLYTVLGKATETDGTGSDGDDESDDGNDSGDDSMDEDENPFASGSLPGGGRGQFPPTTVMADNPFLPELSMTSSGMATSATSMESMVTAPAASSIYASSTSATSAMETTALNSPSLAAATATGTSAASTTTNQPAAKVHTHSSVNLTAAIAVVSVLGVICVAATAYLLFRYCTPLRVRLAAFRNRRGQRLSGEEDGDGAGPTMMQVGNPTLAGARPRQLALASTPNLLSEKLQNPFTDQVPLALSDVSSNGPTLRQDSIPSTKRPPTWASSDTETTYPANTILEEYVSPRQSDGTLVHPSGLANNPPTPVAGKRPKLRRTPGNVLTPLMPAPVAGLNIRESVSTPSPADFPAPTPPESVIDSPMSQYRSHRSITPSESASNAPFSPLPFPAGLMRAMPVGVGVDSRWSRNSSSLNGRTTEMARNSPPRRGSGDGAVPLPPRLPLAVKRSSAGSVASSVRSSGSRASVTDMTR